MALNIAFAGASIVRWSERHYGLTDNTAFAKMLDTEFPDDWLKQRFIEWELLDEVKK